MKRQILIWTLGVAALLGFAGCRDDLADGFNPDEIRLDGQVVSSVQTKADVEIGIDYDTQLTNPLEISLVRWDANGGNNSMVGKTPVEATLGNPVATDEWKRPITFGTPQYYRNRTDNVGFVGWYPRTAGWTSEGGSVIDNQGRMTYTIDGQTDVMVSDFQQGNFGTGIPALTFRHALCMYKIYAYYVDDDAKTQWGNLQQVTFQNLPEHLFVQWPADITSGQATFSYPAPGEGEQYKEVHLFAQDAEGQELPVGTTNSETTYLGTVLGGVPAIGVLGIQIETASKQGGNSVSIARDFKPGYTYHIYLKLSIKGVINAEVSVGKWMYDPDNEITIDQDMVLLTDLSRYGTANSYIVSSANRGYCFDATVKGNGVNTLTRRDGTTIQLPDRDVDIASQIDHVGVYRTDAMVEVAEGGSMSLIETAQRPKTEMITLLSDKLSDGKVKFWVNGFTDEAGKPLPGNYALKYKGNVKIAAYNAQGDIVWSWHIWITDKPQNQGYQNGTVAMDRNLGAVSASPVSPTDYQDAMTVWAGLFYQWGRKDAIFRRTVDDAYDTEEFPMSIKASPVPVADAHKAPSTYFYDPTGNHWTTDTEVNDHFWGYISDREDIVKTLYDPCPPGYRVTGNAMWESRVEDMTVVESPITNSGYFFNMGDYIQVYYPSTACVADGKVYQDDYSGGTEANNYVFQLSATPGADGTAYHFRYEQSAYQESNGTFETLVSDPKYRTKRSAAYPVRCVFEESGPVVTDLSALQTANSYIIRRSGYYKFKANVRGNGVTSLQTVTDQSTGATKLVHFDDGLGQTIAASEMGKADVLWWQGDLTAGSEYLTFANGTESNTAANVEARCPVRMLDNGQVYDNEIMFYADVSEGGNVGIALYNRSGVILWTWHIWIVPEGVRGKQFGDYILMDRNLGATYAPAEADDVTSDNALATYGFYYQWGRKDPMFGPGTYNEATKSTTRSTWFWKNNGTWEKKTKQLDGKGEQTIRSSVQNPLNSLFSENKFSFDAAYWWQTTYVYTQGGDNQVRNLWGYTGATSQGNSFAKTMWDPCPPGYRVMDHVVFATISNFGADTEYNYTTAGEGITQYGVLFNPSLEYTYNSNSVKINADYVWFPYAGWTDKYQVWNNVGDVGVTFSASPFDSGKYGRSFELWPLVNNKVSVKHEAEGWQQQSKPVRCVME